MTYHNAGKKIEFMISKKTPFVSAKNAHTTSKKQYTNSLKDEDGEAIVMPIA